MAAHNVRNLGFEEQLGETLSSILAKLRGGKKNESKNKAGTSKEVGSPRASVKAQVSRDKLCFLIF